jgi:DMSO/TMAO reductase YedYZ molybdopterin-dependent catalytic subunit
MPSLQIEGEVEKPQKLTARDLVSFRPRELGAVLECAGNPVASVGMASSGIWGGVLLSDILSLARPSRAAAYLHMFGRDGYARSVPIDRVHDGAMLVTSLSGRALQPHHGGPWRAFFPGWYGFVSVKWLERVVFSNTPLASDQNDYVEVRPASPVGIVRQPLPCIQVKSVIIYPANRSVVHRGSILVRGLAWSGAGNVSKVEISSDGGAHWNSAPFSPASRYEWVLWQATVDLSQAGAVELLCRATDAEGHTQPAQRETGRLDEYVQNSYHRVQVVVV